MNVEKGHLVAEWRTDGENGPGAKRMLCTDLRQDNFYVVSIEWRELDKLKFI